tara:strand:- start:203 stop:622 length:420 start_codon:yes stop_codon:yes gene_type:complete
MKLLTLLVVLIISKVALAETIQIEFTEDDSYSIEVAHIHVGDRIDWLPKSKGHNVEFLAGPKMDELPPNSKMNQFHSVVFRVPGIYLYGCTPHLNMGMLGLIVVGNDFHNLDRVKEIELSYVATSVLERLSIIAQLDSK